jgi:radical SAM superfamily enzyme YgiQ (UPF0313 family)
MEATLKLAREIEPDITLFNVTTPYPGTEMYLMAEREGYLNHKRWNEYDLTHAVMDLPTLKAEEVNQFYRKAYRQFYLRPSYIWKRLRQLRSWHDIKTSLRGLRAILDI